MALSIIGKRGTLQIADRAANFHPEDWDRQITEIKPMGAQYPLTSAMDFSKKGKTTLSRTFNWSMQLHNPMYGAVTAIKTGSIAGSAYVSGGVVGSVLYVTIADTLTPFINERDVVRITNATDMYSVNADVITVYADLNIIAVALLEADSNTALAVGSDTLYCTVIGRSDKELTGIPQESYQEAEWFSNYSQRIMGAWGASKDELTELERVEPGVRDRLAAQARDKFMMKREWMRWFGTKTVKGDRFFSGGLLYWMNVLCPANIINFKRDTTFVPASGVTFEQGFPKFIENVLAQLMSKSAGQMLTGYTAPTAMVKMVQALREAGNYQITPGVTKWGTPFQEIMGVGGMGLRLALSPQFAENPAFQNTLAIVADGAVETRTFQPQKYVGPTEQRDGRTYVTGEWGFWEVHEGICVKNPYACAYIDGIGETNAP